MHVMLWSYMNDVVSILNLCIAGYVDDVVSIDATPDNQIINI